MDYKEDLLKIISLINNLNQKIQKYNFRLTRGMCVEKFGNSMYSYLENAMDDIGSYRYDYIRLREIELLIDEIKYKKLQGAIAEVGVYRGEISAFLNKLFLKKRFIFLIPLQVLRINYYLKIQLMNIQINLFFSL